MWPLCSTERCTPAGVQGVMWRYLHVVVPEDTAHAEVRKCRLLLLQAAEVPERAEVRSR
ncbi:MAG: hypothetical protein IJU33_04300 [Bacteroidales bacterium]|nr:hypothetical protein [Bacteroidales bacterium]